MLAERASDLGKRQALGMVAGESQSISRLQTVYRSGQRPPHQFEETCPLGWDFFNLRWQPSNRFVVSLDRLETACAAETIDVPLREHGAEPCCQRTAAVEVAEERAPLALSLGHSKEVRVQGVRRFAGGAGLVDGVRRSIEDRPVLADEMFPCRLVSVRARGGKGEVGKVQRSGVAFGNNRGCAIGKGVSDARLQRRGEAIGSHTPSAGVGVPVEPLNNGRVEHRVVLCPLFPHLPPEGGRTIGSTLEVSVKQLVFCLVIAGSVTVAAQWGKVPESPAVPRDAKGQIRYDAPAPRTADGKPDFSGMWMRAQSGPPRGGGAGGRQGEAGRQGGQAPAAQGAAAAGGAVPLPPPTGGGPPAGGAGRGGVSLEPTTAAFPYDPKGPPVAEFFEAGRNMEGGLPYTTWGKTVRDERFARGARDNPDAMCLPMGFLQFHQQPQPRRIYQLPNVILIEYEANYGLRHIYLDGRKLPPQGEPQPFWYGYSVGRWEGNDLVVETNNLRGAEDGPSDGWMDVNGSPYSRGAKFTERFRRLSYGQLQVDLTIDDPKSYTKPWTVRVDFRIRPEEELIEFVCNENQQFRKMIKID